MGVMVNVFMIYVPNKYILDITETKKLGLTLKQIYYFGVFQNEFEKLCGT